MPDRAYDTIGLVAGNGQLPLYFARAARARGCRVVAIGLRGETSEALVDEVDELTWAAVGQLGRMVRTLRRAKVQAAAFAGGVDKRRLFARARLDWTGAQLLWRLARRQDDGVLRAVAAIFEAAGVPIVSSTCVLPELMVPAGVLGRKTPDADQWRDLQFGLEIARKVGALDVGQTAVVCRGAVVALEAIEGTDACLRRAGALTGGKGAVAVKVAKPAQDMRFDVPAIGPTTIKTLAAAGLRVLGLEAHRTLMLEPQATVAAADAAGIALVGLDAPP